MPWGEAVRLVGLLSRDPSSWTCAALAKWEYPLTREAMIFSDLLDVQGGKAIGKKWKPYPRPWDHLKQLLTQRRGNPAGRTPEQVKEILRTQFGQPERSGHVGSDEYPAPGNVGSD